MKKIEYHIESWWDGQPSITYWSSCDGNLYTSGSTINNPKELKVLVIDKVSHKGERFGDISNQFLPSKTNFNLYYNIDPYDYLTITENYFYLYEGCRVIPPNDEWLNKCISAINEYNEYYKEKECEHEWVITSGFSHSTAQLKCKKCGREITAIDMGKEYCKSCGQEIKK